MTVLTSQSHPLTISSVAVPTSDGLIGMTICPGKQQANASSGHFKRDLGLDLDLIKSWGASAVVSLMPQHELESLAVAHLGAEVEARGMQWFHLPIPDVSTPDASFERCWIYSGLRLRQILHSGKNILVHCRGGLGRTGMIAAKLLVELGRNAESAIAEVRQARPGAIQTHLQENYVRASRLPPNDAWLDRLLGCLLGGAVGDAFGYAVEFDSLNTIKTRYGNQGLTQPIYEHGQLIVSDDTQMTLFTMEGMLRVANDRATGDPQQLLNEIRLSYLDWLGTQNSMPTGKGSIGTLAKSAALRVRRAPGNTCLSALRGGGKGSIEIKVNDSKGCGAVMRTAPIGFLQNIDVFDLGARAGALTHGHPEGWAPAGILPRIVANLIKDMDNYWAVRGSFDDACEWGHVYGVTAGTERYQLAIKLARKMRFNPQQAIRLLGQGWVGDEALAIAIYAYLSARNFQDAIIRATNHDGDSDSTASIAGQLWGARHGIGDMPNSWIRRLDVLDEILQLVEQTKGWRVPHEPAKAYSPEVTLSEYDAACIRMVEMTHELHVLGYQKIRLFPYVSPSGAHWRLEWASVENFRSAISPPIDTEERLIARYTSADGWHPFHWEAVESLTPKDMAHQFILQFPEISSAGKGQDWLYAGWMTSLLGEVRKGRFPYLAADRPIDLSRGVPMNIGEPFPLPPALRHEELSMEIVSAEDADDIAPARPKEEAVLDYPLPGEFDFSDGVGRRHGLIAFYHQGEGYLLQVTQFLWQLLPEPKAEHCKHICKAARIEGQGKVGLHKLLERFLLEADEACEAASVGFVELLAPEIDWTRIQQVFDAIDDALQATAHDYSQLFNELNS